MDRTPGKELAPKSSLRTWLAKKDLTRRQVWLARGVAMAADALQIALFPLFVGGAPEGADLIVDVATGAALT